MVLGSENEMVMEAQMRGRHDGNFPAPPGLVVVYIVTGGLHHRLISISPPGMAAQILSDGLKVLIL
jgi:hypothetical protein